MLFYWDHVRAMLGHVWTILDYVWPSFTLRPARALKFSRLGRYGLSNISIECLLCGTISGPCLNQVGTMFGMAKSTDLTDLLYFQDYPYIVKDLCL